MWAKMMGATTCLVLLSLAVWLPVGGASQGHREVRIMSYNIRYGTANDGENHWEKRREFLFETIRHFDPDLLGTQETLAFQRDQLATALPAYDSLGVGRDDGALKGEMTALFYRRERFEKLEGGHLWLSETPDVPASKSWDAALTRMATWVRLRDRLDPQAKPILFLNTHFDHRGQVARHESARLLRRRVATWGADHRVIVTGDFNAGEDTPPYRAFFQEDTEGGFTGRSPLLDTFRVVHQERGAEEGTFSGFQPGNIKGPRIDWIAVDRQWKVRSATIDRTARNGQTPSDHFAVTAIVE
jgi:endonuclease/exonuclease/phosphatase family metal-dependent hydrolase